MKVLIDNGHGAETPGKRSPDGRLREYAYTREIAIREAMCDGHHGRGYHKLSESDRRKVIQS